MKATDPSFSPPPAPKARSRRSRPFTHARSARMPAATSAGRRSALAPRLLLRCRGRSAPRPSIHFKGPRLELRRADGNLDSLPGLRRRRAASSPSRPAAAKASCLSGPARRRPAPFRGLRGGPREFVQSPPQPATTSDPYEAGRRSCRFGAEEKPVTRRRTRPSAGRTRWRCWPGRAWESGSPRPQPAARLWLRLPPGREALYRPKIAG